MKQALPRSARIRVRRRYLEIYREGRRARSRSLTLFALPIDGVGCRLGITVTRKVGGSVVRNRVKRLLRETFRRHRSELRPPMDLVVNAHPEIVGCPAAEIERDFLDAFGRLARRAPGRSHSKRPDREDA